MRNGLNFLQAIAALPLAVLALVAAASGASAQERSCLAEVNNQHLIIVPGLVETDGPSWRERLSRPEEIDGYPACRPAVTIAFLAAMEGLADSSQYCLSRSSDTNTWLLVPGARNRQGECRKTVCDRVNLAREESEEIFRRTAQLATGKEVQTNTDGVVAIAQTTGAMLLTGKSGLIMQALGSGASILGSTLAAPAVAAAGVVTVTAVGGAVYLCKD